MTGHDTNDTNAPATTPMLTRVTPEECHRLCRSVADDIRRLLDHLRREVDSHADGAAVQRDPGGMLSEMLRVRAELIATLGSITGLTSEAVEKSLVRPA